jgi:hypothetical protein
VSTRRRPDYRVPGAGLTFAVLIAIALGVLIDVTAATIAFGFLVLPGTLFAVLMGDVSLPDDYRLPRNDPPSLWRWRR